MPHFKSVQYALYMNRQCGQSDLNVETFEPKIARMTSTKAMPCEERRYQILANLNKNVIKKVISQHLQVQHHQGFLPYNLFLNSILVTTNLRQSQGQNLGQLLLENGVYICCLPISLGQQRSKGITRRSDFYYGFQKSHGSHCHIKMVH